MAPREDRLSFKVFPCQQCFACVHYRNYFHCRLNHKTGTLTTTRCPDHSEPDMIVVIDEMVPFGREDYEHARAVFAARKREEPTPSREMGPRV